MNVPATALDLGTLPGATRRLWNHALRILDAAGAAYGREFDWTWGGGTVMAMRHRHRRSKDVDLFVPNAQYLPYLSPRLSDAAQQDSPEYEEAPEYVKIYYPEGEVDFIAGHLLTSPGAESTLIAGRSIRVETDIEIVAKKLHYRAQRLRARDLYDAAFVLERVPGAHQALAPWLEAAASALAQQLDRPAVALREAFAAIDTWQYTPTFEHCAETVRDGIAPRSRASSAAPQ